MIRLTDDQAALKAAPFHGQPRDRGDATAASEEIEWIRCEVSTACRDL